MLRTLYKDLQQFITILVHPNFATWFTKQHHNNQIPPTSIQCKLSFDDQFLKTYDYYHDRIYVQVYKVVFQTQFADIFKH